MEILPALFLLVYALATMDQQAQKILWAMIGRPAIAVLPLAAAAAMWYLPHIPVGRLVQPLGSIAMFFAIWSVLLNASLPFHRVWRQAINHAVIEV